MAKGTLVEPSHNAQPRPRRLSSFSHLTRAFNRKRDMSSDLPVLSRTKSINNQTSPMSRIRPASPHPKKAGLPRSSTISNLPRIPKARQLQSSTSSVSLMPSRIPTPNGRRSRPTGIIYEGKGMPPRDLGGPPGPKECIVGGTRGIEWRRSRGFEMAMPKVNADGSVAVKATPIITRKPLPKDTTICSIEDKTLPELPQVEPGAVCSGTGQDKNNVQSEVDLGSWPFVDRMSSSKNGADVESESLMSQATITRTSSAKQGEHDTTPLLDTESRRAGRKSEIIHHGLLKELEPNTVPSPKFGTARLLPSAYSRRDYRMLSKESSNVTNVSPKLKSRFMSSLKKMEYEGSPAFPVDNVDSILDPGIYESQPSAYWSGRWVSLNDAILNDVEGEVPLPSPDKDNKLITARKEVDRSKRVFEALEACCKTIEAKRSLWVFQIRFAKMRKMPELIMALPVDVRVDALLPLVDGEDNSQPAPRVKLKTGFTLSRKQGSENFLRSRRNTLASEDSQTSLSTTRSGLIGRLMNIKRKSSWGGSSGS